MTLPGSGRRGGWPMADELAQMGMNVARVLEQQVLAEAAAKAVGKPADPAAARGERDPGLTFTRVARMVSQLLSLADRLDRGVEARAEARRKAAAEAARSHPGRGSQGRGSPDHLEYDPRRVRPGRAK